VKVLFCAAHFGYFRNFESVIVSLATRGHQVHLAADEPDSIGGRELVERLSSQNPGVTFGFAPALDNEPWFRLARKLRAAADYIRFHHPAFASFAKMRLTLRDRLPHVVLRLMDGGVAGSTAGRKLLWTTLRAAERAMPISAASKAFIEEQDPDVVLLASVTAWRVPQIDHLRAARALGRRTGICVFSWDHLSSKALLRSVPDRVFLWNGTQKREAIEWHGMPADRIVITGAQCYDQWFDRAPSRDRASFCRAVGLDPARPILLYVCSVMTPNPYESRFVVRWIDAIRQSTDPRLRGASILVRPHPERMDEWKDVSLEQSDNVAFYGRNPVSPDAQADYFDSLYYSHAVTGIVTSAFLEAAIVGRPVYSPLLPEFQMYQEGVQHFRYLMEVEGGLLRMTRSLPDHLADLSAALEKPVERDAQNRRFIENFVRPGGLTAPATPVFVAAVEELAAAPPPAPARLPVWHGVVQAVVVRIAQSSETGWLRPVFRDTPEATNDRAQAAKSAHRERAAADRARRLEAKQQLLEARRQERRRAQRAEAARTRVDRVNTRVRKQVARLKGRVKSLIGYAS
jgi:hypothetical protein